MIGAIVTADRTTCSNAVEYLVPIKIDLSNLGTPQEVSIQTGTLVVKGERTLRHTLWISENADHKRGKSGSIQTARICSSPWHTKSSSVVDQGEKKTKQATAACNHTHLIVRLPGVLTLSFACCNRARSLWCLALAGAQMPCASLDLLLLCNLSCLKEGA